MSRSVGRQYLFGDVEKECFRIMMHRLARFSGITVLTYCIMDNHFHILLKISDQPAASISDQELLRRLSFLYDRHTVGVFTKELDKARADNNEKEVSALRDLFLYRMGNLSEYMKALKQRFSIWYNRTHDRKGTLWEERYKSVLIEPPVYDPDAQHLGRCALMTVAAYIDLNPVRAGLVSESKDYRWCGCAGAFGGTRDACNGIESLVMLKDGGPVTKPSAVCKYRHFLVSSSLVHQGQVDIKEIPVSELLKCHVRYFNDGLVIGSRAFVNKFFFERRHLFGANRKNGARLLKGKGWEGLCAIRDLQKNALAAPG
jgi:REP element-mobilizing transposase RayT